MFLAEDTVNSVLLSPGPAGFITIIFVGGLTLVLLFDLIRRLRRVNMRADINAKLDAEEAASQDPRSQEKN